MLRLIKVEFINEQRISRIKGLFRNVEIELSDQEAVCEFSTYLGFY